MSLDPREIEKIRKKLRESIQQSPMYMEDEPQHSGKPETFADDKNGKEAHNDDNTKE